MFLEIRRFKVKVSPTESTGAVLRRLLSPLLGPEGSSHLTRSPAPSGARPRPPSPLLTAPARLCVSLFCAFPSSGPWTVTLSGQLAPRPVLEAVRPRSWRGDIPRHRRPLLGPRMLGVRSPVGRGHGCVSSRSRHTAAPSPPGGDPGGRAQRPPRPLPCTLG